MKLALLFLMPLLAHAGFGDKIGNGGGLWACATRGKIMKARLVDLFEAEREFGFTIPQARTTDPVAIFREKRSWIAKNLPNISRELDDSFRYVDAYKREVRAELELIDDRGLFRSRPPAGECVGGEWKYTQFANSNDEQEVLIQSDLWRSKAVGKMDKAALLVHEAVYRWLRLQYGESDSLHTRKVTGILFSDLAPKEMENRILQVLNRPGDPGGTVKDRLGFSLRIKDMTGDSALHTADAPYGHDIGTGNFSSACRIANGGTGDILCILELGELDAYFKRTAIEVNVPSNACEFIRVTPYHFFAEEAGPGPQRVVHSVLPDGSIRDDLNTSNGVPQCPYDHTAQGGANCCTGTFEHTIVTYTSDSSVSTTVKKSWGGQTGNCLAGPAMTIPEFSRSARTGVPLPNIYYVAGTGYNNLFTIPSAVTQAYMERNLQSNVYLANFYNPSDHPEGKPAGLLKGRSGYTPSDTYTWECLDAAQEVKSRIRLMIREWNTSPVQEGANPDVTGFQNGDPNLPINNRLDWKDFGPMFPGELL